MSPVRIFWVWLMVVCLSARGAQGWRDLPVPPPPASGILDDARLFQTAPERLAALEQRVTGLAQRTGLPVFVVFYDSLIGRTLSEEVVRLQDAWLGDEAGVLLAVETGSGRYWLLWADGDPVAPPESPMEVPVLRKGVLPPHDQLMIDQQIQDLGRMRTGSVDHAEKMVGVLVDGIERSLAAGESDRGTARWTVLGLGVLGLLLALVVGWVFTCWTKRGEARASERYLFPELRIERRLGAPYGAGKVRETSFASPSSG